MTDKEAKQEKKVWKRPFFLINSGLVVLIIAFVLLRWYKVPVTIDSTFGSKPIALLKILEESFPELPQKEIDVVFVFNSLPSGAQVESLEKLSKNVGTKANIVALFNKTFMAPSIITYPHHFSRYLVIKYTKDGNLLKNNFFVILRNRRIEYLDEIANFSTTSFLVLKKIDPNLEYKDLAIGMDELKAKIIKRLRAGNLSLLSLGKDEYERIDSILSRGSYRLYFFHANCSSCQLKSILSNIKLKQILDPGEIVLIFSVMADRFELSRILSDQKIDLEVFLDQEDEFGLFSIISEERNNPVIIEPAEINQ